MQKVEDLLDTVLDIFDGKGDESYALSYIINEVDSVMPELLELRSRLVSEDNYVVVHTLLNDLWSVRNDALRSMRSITLESLAINEAELRDHYDGTAVLDIEDVHYFKDTIVEQHQELSALAERLVELAA